MSEGINGDQLLRDVKVLDFTRMLAGPWAAEILSDLGADVIKIEEPRIGDPTRKHRPLFRRASSYFMAVNRGKRSVAIDVRTTGGKQIVDKLLAEADIVLENFRPGVMARLGIDYDTVRETNPDIIFCSLSGFGATGPLSERISFDLVNQAFAGIVDVTGHPGNKAARAGVPIGDLAGGVYLAIAALSGLQLRNRTGQGAWVDLSLHDTLISFLGSLGQAFLLDAHDPTRIGNAHYATAPSGCYQASDDWIVLEAVDQSSWQRLVTTPALEHLARDSRFVTEDQRLAGRADLDALLAAAIKTDTADHWVQVLNAARVPAARVLNVKQTLESELLAQRGMIFAAPADDPEALRSLASPILVDGARLGMGTIAPDLGQHSLEVLQEIGYSASEANELLNRARTVPDSPTSRPRR